MQQITDLATAIASSANTTFDNLAMLALAVRQNGWPSFVVVLVSYMAN